jgi:hypothetical protein
MEAFVVVLGLVKKAMEAVESALSSGLKKFFSGMSTTG